MHSMKKPTSGHEKLDWLIENNRCISKSLQFDAEADEMVEAFCGEATIDSKSVYCSKHAREKMRMSIYEKSLSGALKEFVKNQIESDPSEQTSIFEELALMRHTATINVKLYNKTISKGDVKLNEAIAVGTMLADKLQDVAALAEKAQRIEMSSANKLGATSLAFMLDNIVRIIYEKLSLFGESGTVAAQQIEEAIRETIQIDDTTGTRITPDQDAIDMDNSVPAAPKSISEVPVPVKNIELNQGEL